MRVLFASALEMLNREAAEAEIVRVKRGVLTREEDRGRKASGGEGIGDGCQLDCFRPGANHQPYVGDTQPSP